MAGGMMSGIEEGGFLVGKVEIAFGGGGVVALEAVLGEDGLDVVGEKNATSLCR